MTARRWIGVAAVAAAAGIVVALLAGDAPAPAKSATTDRTASDPAPFESISGPSHPRRSRADPRVVFGRSVEGRELVAMRSGPEDGERTSLVVGEIHGDEEAGRAVVRRLRRDGAPRAATVWTVLTVNPDGHEAGRRVNAREVDLSRNFPVGWDGSEPPGSGYYGGAAPLSEPESRALKGLIERIDPDVSIYYHEPWGAVLLPCSGPAREQQLYSRISGLPEDRCRGQRLPGTVTRWQRGRFGTAFVVELEAGPLSRADVNRHDQAVGALARP